MGIKLISAITALAIIIAFYTLKRTRQGLRARQQGCQLPRLFQSIDPFFGFDLSYLIHQKMGSIYGLHERYGKTFLVAPLFTTPKIMTVASENLQSINNGIDDWGVEPFRRPGMEYFCGLGFIDTDGSLWQHSRKLLRPTFNKSNLLDFSSSLSVEVDDFLDKLPQGGVTVDLQPLFFLIFLNTSIKFLLGVDARSESQQAPCSPGEFVDAFHDGVFGSALRIIFGSFAAIIPKPKYWRGVATSHQFLDFYVNKAMERRDSAKIHVLEPVKHSSLIEGLAAQTDDRIYIRYQILQALMASQETTSNLLGNTVFLLSRHPNHWEQIREEALKMGNNISSFDVLLSSKILQNILYESLRLYPIFPMLGRTALKDTKLPVGGGVQQEDPIFVPEGTIVEWSNYAMHRDPSVFGNDVEVFNPDRWDSIKPGPWQYMPFGGGPRNCLGQQKVLVEAAYTLAKMALKFEKLESRDDRPWKGDIKLTCKNGNGCKVALYNGSLERK